jgi:adenylate cyclase 10
MDDKGSTFICLWGVCPLSHEDDAARAILTGFNIIRELSKIETSCKIGISSGEVFSGVVGTSGSRKEFSVLGDVVNLAARIMGSLKYSNQTMCVDLNTRNLASC